MDKTPVGIFTKRELLAWLSDNLPDTLLEVGAIESDEPLHTTFRGDEHKVMRTLSVEVEARYMTSAEHTYQHDN